MSKNANEYPVTTRYGLVAGYPLNGGFHRGIDYGAPLNTPVRVNNVEIALTGSTGASTGPHLHVGKWQGTQVYDPGTGGFTFNNAVVAQIGQDPTNGKFIMLHADGFTWIYCHLNKINVEEGDKIVNLPPINKGDLENIYPWIIGRGPNNNDINYWTTGERSNDWKAFAYDLANRPDNIARNQKPSEYEEVPFKVYKKKG